MPALRESMSFLKEFVSRPTQVGAVAPSSRFLARALCRPLSQSSGPLKVLELGAGTGAVTAHIIPLLGDGDCFDICEANTALADHLRARFIVEAGPLAIAHREGRTRLFDRPIQEVKELLQYDFIISGLPLTAFELKDVEDILGIVKRCLKPGGTFSYFEYIAIRPLLTVTRRGRRGQRFRALSSYLTRQIRAHQIDRQAVLLNIPPAFARHFCFDE
jgi:phospholipid N-methyltransferase